MNVYRTRTKAWQAMKNREDELEGQWRIDTVRVLDETIATIGDPCRQAIARLHMPDEESVEFAAGPLHCPRCQIECCREPDDFPCATFTLAAGIETVDLPPFPAPLMFADYWTDPDVEIVLNHPTTHPPYRGAPTGVKLLVRHSDAMKMLGALRSESRSAVEALT